MDNFLTFTKSIFRLVCATGVVLFGGLILQVNAQEVGAQHPSDLIITNVAGDPSCDARVAQAIQLADIVKERTHLLAKCVSVEGVLSDRMLFDSSKEARIHPLPVVTDHINRRLGVYATDELKRTFPVDMSRVVLIGKVGDCDELSHRDGVVMVSGYCHYSPGAYIAVSAIGAKSPKGDRP